MAVAPYTDPAIANQPSSSYDIAHRDDFFGFSNPMQAINSITPRYTNSDGTVQQPTQIVTVSSGGVPYDMSFASSSGTLFDLRSPDEIFADMDVRLNRQRQYVLDSPHLWKMLEKQ